MECRVGVTDIRESAVYVNGGSPGNVMQLLQVQVFVTLLS